MEMHGGSIAAQSAGRGKGTTFVIDLPVRHDDVSAVSAEKRV
jgi:signal transduction histidine kinase